MQRSFADFAQARDAATPAGDDPTAALLARCRALHRFALASPGPYRYLFSKHAPTGDPARPRVDPPVFQALAESISRCQQVGLARAGDDPHWLAAQVWAALRGLVLLRLNAPRFPLPGPLEQMADQAVARPHRPRHPGGHPPRLTPARQGEPRHEPLHRAHPQTWPRHYLAGLAAAAFVSAVIPAAAALAFLISLATRRPLIAVAAGRWPWLTGPRRPRHHRTLAGLTAGWGFGLLAVGAIQSAGSITGGLTLTSPASFTTRAPIGLAAVTIAWLHRNPDPGSQARSATPDPTPSARS